MTTESRTISHDLSTSTKPDGEYLKIHITEGENSNNTSGHDSQPNYVSVNRTKSGTGEVTYNEEKVQDRETRRRIEAFLKR